MKKFTIILLAILPLSLLAQEEEPKERAEISLNIRGWNNSYYYTSQSTYRDSLLNPYTKYSSNFSRTFQAPIPSISFKKSNLNSWEFGLINLRISKYEEEERIDSNGTSRYIDNSGKYSSYSLDFFIAKRFGFTEKFLPEVFIQLNASNYLYKNFPLVSKKFRSRSLGLRGDLLVGAEYKLALNDWISCSAGVQYSILHFGVRQNFVDDPSRPRIQNVTNSTYGRSSYNQKMQLRLGVSLKL
jgi:hypothetical protein